MSATELTTEQVLSKEEIPVLNHGYVRYVAHLGDDNTPLEAARMSTGNPTGDDKAKDDATRDYLWRNRHATPFEMTVLQIEVQVPIFVAREWQRSRTMSYNEASGRYMEMPSLFYVPTIDRVQGQGTTNKQGSEGELDTFTRACFIGKIAHEQKEVRQSYEEHLKEGVARELARINLPLSQFTRFRAQAVLRNWFHFLDLRMRENAQWEIRQYANVVAGIIKALWPEAWAVFEEHTLEGEHISRTERALLMDAIAGRKGEKWLLTEAYNRMTSGQVRDFQQKFNLGLAKN